MSNQNTQLKPGALTEVVYHKNPDNVLMHEVSNRSIIPVHVPDTNIRAIDVTGDTDAEKRAMTAAVNDYYAYRKQFMETMFTFEAWIEHTTGVAHQPKWRAFKQGQLTIL